MTATTLRDPAYLVSPNAVRYWALSALVGLLMLAVPLLIVYAVVPDGVQRWLGPVAIVLLLSAGGLSSLQSMVISTGLPFTLVLLVMCFAIWKGLVAERKHT